MLAAATFPPTRILEGFLAGVCDQDSWVGGLSGCGELAVGFDVASEPWARATAAANITSANAPVVILHLIKFCPRGHRASIINWTNWFISSKRYELPRRIHPQFQEGPDPATIRLVPD